MADGLLQSVISAASGLIGVALGGYMTSRREDKRATAQSSKEAAYLAILVGAHLNRLATQCAYVAMDDGTDEGRPAGQNGTWETTVETPTFNPLSFEVEWKALPPALMYSILNLPYRIDTLNHEIAILHNYEDLPDFTHFFWARRSGYAELGLEISRLAIELRQYAGLPEDPVRQGAWDRDESMREQLEIVAAARKRMQKITEARETKRQALADAKTQAEGVTPPAG